MSGNFMLFEDGGRWRGRTVPALCCSLLAAVLAPATGLGQTENQIVSIGISRGWAELPTVAPGDIVTLFTTALNVPDAVATGTPLPRSLSGVTVLVRVVGANDTTGYPDTLPILRVVSRQTTQFASGPWCPAAANVSCHQTQITVQIPAERVCAPSPSPGMFNCAGAPSTFNNVPPLLILNVQADGVTGPDLPLRVFDWRPRVLNSCDSIFGPQNLSSCHDLITHSDGSLVSAANPARIGETITVWATGLGASRRSGQAPQAPAEIPRDCCGIQGIFRYTFELPEEMLVPGTSRETFTSTFVEPEYVGLAAGSVGLYQVNLKVPPVPGGARPCTFGSNGSLQISFQTPERPVWICVQP